MIYQFNATRYEAAAILFKDLPSIGSGSIDRIPESTILMPATEFYNPATWLKTGYSPTEIILAMAIFVGVILSKRR